MCHIQVIRLHYGGCMSLNAMAEMTLSFKITNIGDSLLESYNVGMAMTCCLCLILHVSEAGGDN